MSDLEQLTALIAVERTWARTMSDGYTSAGSNTSEHLAQAIINAGWTGPVPDPWCREEDCEYRHWRSGPMPTHQHGDGCPPRGYTTHGHPIKGQVQSGKQPLSVARCGGPRLCKQCAKETN